MIDPTLPAPAHGSSTSLAAVAELVLAGTLWGFGFVAAIWALRSWGPMTVTALRFGLAVSVGYCMAYLIPSVRRHLTRKTLKLALIPSCFLCATLLFQTWGLEYTTATKSSFITCFYVLVVPIFERVWRKQTLPRFHFLFVILALVGLALICDLGSIWRAHEFATTVNLKRQQWNLGDVLTLACAIAASLHILWISFINKKIESPFAFNLSQTVWALIPAVGFAIFERQPAFKDIQAISVLGLCSLAFGSTLIAFALQIRAQKEISASLASLLFLLESPFATLFAIFLLGETLRLDQWFGAFLILASVIATTMLHSTPIASPPPE